MRFLRNAGAVLFWLLAIAAFSMAVYQVAPLAGQVMGGEANVAAAGEGGTDEGAAPAAEPPGWPQLVEAANGVVPWLILATFCVANATLLRILNGVLEE